jgi:hypothetical protein
MRCEESTTGLGRRSLADREDVRGQVGPAVFLALGERLDEPGWQMCHRRTTLSATDDTFNSQPTHDSRYERKVEHSVAA